MPIKTATQRIAASLRAEMARQRMTQETLAAAAGLSQPAVSRRLSGHSPLTVDDVERFADILGVTTDRLLSAHETGPATTSQR